MLGIDANLDDTPDMLTRGVTLFTETIPKLPCNSCGFNQPSSKFTG